MSTPEARLPPRCGRPTARALKGFLGVQGFYGFRTGGGSVGFWGCGTEEFSGGTPASRAWPMFRVEVAVSSQPDLLKLDRQTDT